MTYYLIFINVLGLIICIFDKYLAKRGKYRISEKLLLSICLIGGIFGFIIASRVVRHKTKDKKFLTFMYPMLIVWILILFYLTLC